MAEDRQTIVASPIYPDFFARFYDVIYDKVRDHADHSYYLQKILETKGSVLEVGVGTGRFFNDALSKGADIYGIDISPAMIGVLKARLPESEHFRVSICDLCRLNMSRRFDLVIAPFRVFMHLIETKQQIMALNKVYDHLNPGGKFIFDLFVPKLKLLTEGLHNFNDFTGEYESGKKLERYTSMTVDIIRQISHVSFRFVWEEKDEEKTAEWKTDLRFFFRYELEYLVKQSKLTLVNIFGGFDESPLDKDSKEFVVMCERSE
jgi:SAM-dependent methyltransferase